MVQHRVEPRNDLTYKLVTENRDGESCSPVTVEKPEREQGHTQTTANQAAPCATLRADKNMKPRLAAKQCVPGHEKSSLLCLQDRSPRAYYLSNQVLFPWRVMVQDRREWSAFCTRTMEQATAQVCAFLLLR